MATTTTTLTLTADERLVRTLERMAADRNTDVHSLVMGLLEAFAHTSEGRASADFDEHDLPPVTRSALGLLQGIPDRPWKELLTEALTEKYGFDT